MKYMYALLFGLMGVQACASVYATAGVVDEAIGRGATEPFAQGVGCLMIKTEKTALSGNCILVSEDTILTNAHVFKAYDAPTDGAVFFHPAPDEMVGKSMDDILYAVDVSSIVYHPTLDLAVAKLVRKLSSIPALPLMLDKPKELKNGYLVSFGDMHVLGAEAALHKCKRHISIMPVTEVVTASSAGMDVAWVKEWDVPEALITDPKNKIFKPQAGDHRLSAFSLQGDSASPFIVKTGGEYRLAGLYKGKGRALSSVGPTKPILVSRIIPLWTAAEWIKANI